MCLILYDDLVENFNINQIKQVGTYNKVRKLRKMANKQDLKTHIEIDGGVSTANARKLLDAGADVLVAGSFVFKSDNPTETIADLKSV